MSSNNKTALYNLHIENKAKMVSFANYMMPIQYEAGIKTEHLHTRTKAGLFDVSHMGQIIIRGTGVAQVLETLVPVDVIGLQVNQQRYAVFTNQQGGIEDDLMITRWAADDGEECLGLVVNAACKHQDLAHLQTNFADADISGYSIDYLDDHALLALQGPGAARVMESIIPEVADTVFMQGVEVTVDGGLYRITRSGYTGEDGFEISLPNAHADAFAKKLLVNDDVELVGLGARDSLRLEAGLCLYGHDMTNETTPLEASLLWSISKNRRPDGERAGAYVGSEVIAKQIKEGVSRKRVGLKINAKVPVREGADLQNTAGEKVGVVTSGGYSPSLSEPIAMGYVDLPFNEKGTDLVAIVRGRPIPVSVQALPFVKQNYYRG